MPTTPPPLRLLIVEDHEDAALLIVRHLSRRYTVGWRRVDNEAALREALLEEWDVIVTDHALPQLDAPRVLRITQELAPATPAAIVSGAIAEGDAVALLQAGANAYFFKDRLAGFPDGIAHIIQEMRGVDQMIIGLTKMLAQSDRETEEHSRRVTVQTVGLARALGIVGAPLLHMRRGAMLHDIGKMGVPWVILHKAGPLDDAEWAIMRRHPSDAYDMLAGVDALQKALDIPYGHHERWDGRGYPRGLAGEDIPLAARIFAFADAWDALTSTRPYRAARTRNEAIAAIRIAIGTHFDPTIAAVFLAHVEAGTL